MSGIVGISLGTIGAVSGLIVAHIANPALAFVTVPIALQAILAVVIKKSPKSIAELKGIVSEILVDAPDDLKDKFVDEISTQYSSRGLTTRSASRESTEPIPTPSETEDVMLPAKYHKRTGTYDVFTPRVGNQLPK